MKNQLFPLFKLTMTKTLLLSVLLLLSTTLFAQNKSVLKGVVLDSVSKSPAEFVTVAVVNAKDTSLISYTITNKNGVFSLTGLPANKETKLIISAMGYSTFRKLLIFKPAEVKDLGAIYLNNKLLGEVLVRGERTPIIQKKDTLEFNTEAFKTRPNAVVEDLLRLLPGVQVNVDGSILVNGKAVNKMLIDGKRFFGSNPTVATKNLDADMVASVQVYDDREEDPDHKLTDLEVGKIINLKMKSKIKKSTLGKVYAGAGTRDRYEAGGILSTFRDTLQVSVIGTTNNLTRTGFSSAELYSMGGFNRSGGNVQNEGTFGGNGDGGIEKMWSGGFNVNNDYGKKLKTNVMYFYYNYVKDYDKKTLTEQNLDQTLLTTANNNLSQLRQQRHTVSSLIEWAPDTIQKTRFDVRIDISPTGFNANGFTNTFNTQLPKLSELLTTQSSESLAKEFTDNFMYYRRLKKPGSSLTISQTLYIKKSNSDDYNYNNLTSYTSDFKSSVLDRFSNSKYAYFAGGIDLTYNRPLSKKVSNEIYLHSRFYSTENKLATYDKSPLGGYDDFLADQSSDLERPHYIQNIKNTLSYNFSQQLTLKAAVDLEIQSYTNNFNSNIPNTLNRYTYLFPSLRLNGQKFSINYTEQANPPDISQMQPITRQVSPLETFSGNPNLTPNRQRNLSYNYYSYNNDKQSYLSLNGNLTILSNNIVQVSTKDANGFITSTYANKNGGWTANVGLNKGKQFKKSQTWKFSLNNGIYGYYDQRSFFFNGDGGTQYNYFISVGQSVGVNYKSVVNLNSSYSLQQSITNYGGVNYASVHSLRHNATSVLSVTWPKSFIFDAQYRYLYNPQIAPGFPKSSNVVNLAVTMMMFKQNRGQVKLSVYDLFNENISAYRYATNNSIVNVEQQILRRYFLINYQYKINVSKTK
jgi:hypothetical protein